MKDVRVEPDTHILDLLNAGARIELASGHWLQGMKGRDDIRMGLGQGDLSSQTFLGYGEKSIDMVMQDLGELMASGGYEPPDLTRSTTLHELMRMGLRVRLNDSWLQGEPQENRISFGTHLGGPLGHRSLDSEFSLRSALRELERVVEAKVLAFPAKLRPAP